MRQSPKNSYESFIIEGREFTLNRRVLIELLEASLAKGVPLRFIVRGFSMSPFIKDGDIITVSNLNKKSLIPGIIVIFKRAYASGLAVHRIVARKKGSYLIKGDNLFNADGWVSQENIIGYVAQVERKGKKVLWGIKRGGHLVALMSRARLLGYLLYLWRLIPLRLRKAIGL
ncbi:MAG: S26 family signal peptidase [Candidatus Omnitrophica bacterium]|nr:S26 family signal peptidase [Candidatus Omnitrophota bacterium]